MTTIEAKEAFCAIKIDGPTLILVDAEQVNIDLLMKWPLSQVINETVLVIPVIGPPSVISLSLEALKEAVKKLEAR